MGRLIDADDLEKQILEYYQNQLSEIEAMAFVEFLAFIDDFSTAEAIPKADYEHRLKTDLADMLAEIQQEIEENVLADDPNTLLPFLQARETCVAVIQQKINSLKENKSNE